MISTQAFKDLHISETLLAHTEYGLAKNLHPHSQKANWEGIKGLS